MLSGKEIFERKKILKSGLLPNIIDCREISISSLFFGPLKSLTFEILTNLLTLGIILIYVNKESLSFQKQKIFVVRILEFKSKSFKITKKLSYLNDF